MPRTAWIDRLRALAAALESPRGGDAAAQGPELGAAIGLAHHLVSEQGEVSGASLSRTLADTYRRLGDADRLAFFRALAEEFAPDPHGLRAAAEAYAREPSAENAWRLFEAAEPPRQEVLRRLNMSPGGTALLVGMRAQVLAAARQHPALKPLEADLKHLLASWFNRGFLELRRIDWDTPASVLEKLIAYEAVHEIQGWDDLRRRLAPDRRCFAFFHPAFPGEPLIFVEVALTRGMATAIQPLLLAPVPEAGGDPRADTAIFYSISNCQPGLRGISFGNLLIKQVVERLQAEKPAPKRFATLSPVPGFRRWLERRIAGGARGILLADERPAIVAAAGRAGAKGAFHALLASSDWPGNPKIATALKAPLMRLCAEYLTGGEGDRRPTDPVARFHLGNGARLERIDWLGNPGPKGLRESYGLMVNYLYDPGEIEANHEAFARLGTVVRSGTVEALLRRDAGRQERTTGLFANFGRRRAPHRASKDDAAAPQAARGDATERDKS